MRRNILIILLTVFSCFTLNAQTYLPTQAIDFNTKDCHGNPIHLFEILDEGQYVLIDFFNRNCGPCNLTAPYVKEAYEILGCNAHDVFFMEISRQDSDSTCRAWDEHYGIEFPTISGQEGGGYEISNSYAITVFPTIILIAPDRNIVIKYLEPINNANTIVNDVAAYGILPNDCPPTLYAPTNVEVAIDDNIVILTWDAPTKIDLVGYNVYKDGELIAEEITDTEFSHECEGGIYEFCVSSVYDEGESKKVCKDVEVIFCNHEIELRQTWLLVKAYGVLLIWEEIINIHSGEFVQYNIYRDGEIIDSVEENIYFDQDPPNETHTYMVSALYDDGCETFSNEIEGEAGYIGIENYNSTFIIYPNPVNDYLNIETIETSNQYVEIYNFAGSLMIKEKINPQINVSSLAPGLYIIKIDNVKQKFIKQ